jgi:hypothetical protein
MASTPADVKLLALVEALAAGDTAAAGAILAHGGQTPEPVAPATAPPPAPAKMADAVAHGGQEPASGEVALAGRDGAALARLIRASKAAGVSLLADTVRDALKRYPGEGPLLSAADRERVAESLAAVNATAELLGRSRVREMAGRVSQFGTLTRMNDESLSTFADGFVDFMATPEDAVNYFMGLFPDLGVDPDRFPGEQRRRAFTLAESVDQTLTARVQKVIGSYLRDNRPVADAAAKIRQTFQASGVHPRNPQYAEMVFRTNAMDAFQTGMYEEGRTPEVRAAFPAWEYLGIDDERAGDDHRPKFGKFYPPAAAFASVRGKRPYNCRCSLRWVDRYEWDEHLAAGRRLETRW